MGRRARRERVGLSFMRIGAILVKDAGIDRPAIPGNRLEVQLIAIELNQHEVIVLGKCLRDRGRRRSVAEPQ